MTFAKAILWLAERDRLAVEAQPNLDALWRKGRTAWADVPSAAQWVEELRGNKTPAEEPMMPISHREQPCAACQKRQTRAEMIGALCLPCAKTEDLKRRAFAPKLKPMTKDELSWIGMPPEWREEFKGMTGV